MTEPHAGADPALFTTQAVRDGDEWVITGEKWFSSNARYASFVIVMALTDVDAGPYQGMSMFIVPADTPGLEIVRNVGIGGEPAAHASHAYLRYNGVRVPADHVLGGEGQAFAISQTRLGGGRVHHAMRTVARIRAAFDMMCERAVSRQTRKGSLGSLQMVQEAIADSWIEIEQFRLLVLRTAWLIDRHRDYHKVRKDIAAIKVADAEGVPRRRAAGDAPSRCAGRLERDAVRRHADPGRGAGHRRRADRSPQGHGRAARC